MDIEYTKSNNVVSMGELSLGTVFKSLSGSECIKITSSDDDSSDSNAIDLECGVFVSVGLGVRVKPLKCKLVIDE